MKKKKNAMGPGGKKEGRWRSERHPPAESRQLQESKVGRNISDKQCKGGACVEDRKFPLCTVLQWVLLLPDPKSSSG